MSATEIKLAALTEGRAMGLFVIGSNTHRMRCLPSGMPSAGNRTLDNFIDLRSATEGDTRTDINHLPNLEFHNDELEGLLELKFVTDSEDEQGYSNSCSYWDRLSKCRRHGPVDNNSPVSLTVHANKPVYHSEGDCTGSHGKVVLEVEDPSERLEGEDAPNFAKILENQRDIDVADDAPLYCAMERAL